MNSTLALPGVYVPNSIYSVQYAVSENNVLTEYSFDKTKQNDLVTSDGKSYRFYDDGGSDANYSTKIANSSVIFDAGVGNNWTIAFNSWKFEQSTYNMYDRLGIQGSNDIEEIIDDTQFTNAQIPGLKTSATTSVPWSTSSGSSGPGWILPKDTASIVDNSFTPGQEISFPWRYIRFVFVSDYGTTFDGWDITLKPVNLEWVINTKLDNSDGKLIKANQSVLKFFDDGGEAGKYSNNQSYSATFDAGENQTWILQFNNWAFERGGGSGYMYDRLGIEVSGSDEAGSYQNIQIPWFEKTTTTQNPWSIYSAGVPDGWILPGTMASVSDQYIPGDDVHVYWRYIKFTFISDFGTTDIGWDITLKPSNVILTPRPAVFLSDSNVLSVFDGKIIFNGEIVPVVDIDQNTIDQIALNQHVIVQGGVLYFDGIAKVNEHTLSLSRMLLKNPSTSKTYYRENMSKPIYKNNGRTITIDENGDMDWKLHNAAHVMATGLPVDHPVRKNANSITIDGGGNITWTTEPDHLFEIGTNVPKYLTVEELKTFDPTDYIADNPNNNVTATYYDITTPLNGNPTTVGKYVLRFTDGSTYVDKKIIIVRSNGNHVRFVDDETGELVPFVSTNTQLVITRDEHRKNTYFIDSNDINGETVILWNPSTMSQKGLRFILDAQTFPSIQIQVDSTHTITITTDIAGNHLITVEDTEGTTTTYNYPPNEYEHITILGLRFYLGSVIIVNEEDIGTEVTATYSGENVIQLVRVVTSPDVVTRHRWVQNGNSIDEYKYTYEPIDSYDPDDPEKIEPIHNTYDNSSITKNETGTFTILLDNVPVKIEPETATTSSATTGDPYIYPVDGPITKLPNQPGMYRVFQHKHRGTYVDIKVDEMKLPPSDDYKATLSWADPIDQGYYIQEIHIHKGNGKIDIVDVTDSKCFGRIELPWTSRVKTGIATQDTEDMGGMFEGTYESRVLNIDDVGKVEIRIFDNKQIRNGMIWHLPEKSDHVDGLVYKNYKPKLFETSGKNHGNPYIKLPNKRVLTNRSIVGHNEVAMSVKQPTLFKQIYC